MKEVEYSSNKALALVGGKITGVFMDENKEHWGLTIKKGKMTVQAWVESDTEGNAAGDLFISEEVS